MSLRFRQSMRLTRVGTALLCCVYALACASGGAPTSVEQHSNGYAGSSDVTAPNDAPDAGAGTSGLEELRIRRLSNAEYDATVQALLGTELGLGAGFVPDARLHKYAKFDRNEAQVARSGVGGSTSARRRTTSR